VSRKKLEYMFRATPGASAIRPIVELYNALQEEYRCLPHRSLHFTTLAHLPAKIHPDKNIEHRKKIDGTPFQEGDIIKIIALASGDYSKYFQFTYIFPKLFHF